MKTFFAIICVSLLFSCTTTRDYTKERITDRTKTKDALEIAIAKGGVFNIKNALRLVAMRGEQDKSKAFLLEKLLGQEKELPFYKKANTIALLQSFRVEPKHAILLFEKFKASLNRRQRELAWGVATAFPSAEMAVHVEKHLSAALVADDLDRELFPAMADALAENQLVSSYSIVRRGLFLRHDIAFAQAMIRLDSEKAEEDFLTYLGGVPEEQLEQLHLENYKIEVCFELLEFLATRAPAPNQKSYSQLFNFAISRNDLLSVPAMKVIESSSSRYREHVAQKLAELPNKVQMAYIEKVRRNATSQAKLLLKQLRKYSSKIHIQNEIDDILR